jgi:hypothetical protein
VENIILPELKQIEVDYYQTYSEVVHSYYKVNFESFSKQKRIVNNFFRYDGDDTVDINYIEPYDKDYGDSEFIDSGINDIT